MAEQVTIDNIQDGMVLSEPVLNKHGQVLIGKDIKLENKHIRILKSWNVQFVYIKNNEKKADTDNISKELLKLAVLDLKKIIKWKPSNEYEVSFLNACIKYKVLESK